jgi:hypothetical protein
MKSALQRLKIRRFDKAVKRHIGRNPSVSELKHFEQCVLIVLTETPDFVIPKFVTQSAHDDDGQHSVDGIALPLLAARVDYAGQIGQ